MKRPLSHIIVPVACLLMLPFCLPDIALGGETRNHTGGRFQLEIGNNDAGWIQSVEGGAASSETVQEKLGPVPKQSTVAPQQRNLLRPVQPIAPVKPACPNPPCGLQAQQDAAEEKKDSLSEAGEEKQLQIQMHQDRNSKATTTLSNTLKKNSDTQSGIIGNMK